MYLGEAEATEGEHIHEHMPAFRIGISHFGAPGFMYKIVDLKIFLNCQWVSNKVLCNSDKKCQVDNSQCLIAINECKVMSNPLKFDLTTTYLTCQPSNGFSWLEIAGILLAKLGLIYTRLTCVSNCYFYDLLKTNYAPSKINYALLSSHRLILP